MMQFDLAATIAHIFKLKRRKCGLGVPASGFQINTRAQAYGKVLKSDIEMGLKLDNSSFSPILVISSKQELSGIASPAIWCRLPVAARAITGKSAARSEK